MSRTQRCIICTETGRVNELEEDEVCPACGRCVDHCTAPHQLDFRSNAKLADGKVHPDAGKSVTVDYFRKGEELEDA